MNNKIDVVIPWVDGNDENWKKEKDKYYRMLNPSSVANATNRYQSWDNLKYLFRGIEKFMPWINCIYFVTWGHAPEFININNEKIKIVRHEEYIPEEFLPTFSSRTIDTNFHRIDGLSDNFISFNDDMFILKPVEEEYFFINNIPCDEAIETPIIPVSSDSFSKYVWAVRMNNIAVINKNFNKREVHKKFYEKWFNECYGELLERNNTLKYWDNFVGIRDHHLPVAYNKLTFDKVWNIEKDLMERTCYSKFRNIESVNHWLIRYWQLCEGNFIPRKTQGKSFVVNMSNYVNIAEIIENQLESMICLNEMCSEDEFITIKTRINNALNNILPEKSMFEK